MNALAKDIFGVTDTLTVDLEDNICFPFFDVGARGRLIRQSGEYSVGELSF